MTYEEFPDKVTGLSVWDGKYMEGHPDEWIYYLSSQDIKDIDSAIKHFMSLNLPLHAINQENFPLSPTFTKIVKTQLHNLFNGLGFGVFRGFPVHKYSREEQIAAFMGIGSYIGTMKYQNRKGHVLGHVKDLTQGSTTKVVYDVNDPTTRIYATKKAQPFHVDGTDVVCLLALSDGVEGGLSSVISSHTLYNRLRELRPDIVELMKKPWLGDRKNEESPGEIGYREYVPLTYYKNRLFTFWAPHFFQTVDRFPGIIIEEEKLEAMKYIEDLCQKEALNMKLEVGDIQFVQNYQLFHARTAYTDSPESTRHLLRLWLTVDPKEVGWEIPQDGNNFQYDHDGHPVVPLEAE